MESYSVNVNNRFALFLDEEDDPGDVIVIDSVKKEESTKTTKTSKQQASKNVKGKENKDKTSQQANKKPVENGNKSADRPSTGSKSQQYSTGSRDRGNNRRDRERGERDDRPPRGPRTGQPRLSSKEKEGEGGFSGGGSGGDDQGNRRDGRSGKERGPRPFRGRGGSTGGSGMPRKREFERRSGNDKSSVKAFEKRDGGGARNWGRQEDQLNEEWNNEEEPPQTTEPVTNGEATEEKIAEEQTEETTLVDEEPQEMTLEEYRAKNPTGRVKADVEERKAGENVDNTQWKDTFQLEKTDEEFFSGTREVIEKLKTSGRVKTTIDATGFFFKDQARRGRGRTPGGPGAGRGPGRRSGDGEERQASRGDSDRDRDRRGGKGERRPFGDGSGRGERKPFGRGRKRDHAPNVEDEKDFPSLGAL